MQSPVVSTNAASMDRPLGADMVEIDDVGNKLQRTHKKRGMPSDAPGAQNTKRWVDPLACSALCQLILDERSPGAGSSEGQSARTRRRPLPPALYAESIAPFLRFDLPQPNMLYAFGGRNQKGGPLNTVEMFDTWHGRWVTCKPMPTKRAGSAAALLPDNRIVVVGGYDSKGISEGLLSSCDVYDPYSQTWSESGIAPLKRARWGHGCALLGGKVYVVGGCSLQRDAQPREAFMETLRCCEVYDPELNTWSSCASLQVARSGSRVVALGDRYLAAVGGCDDVFGRAETQPTVEIFDAVTGQWSLLHSRLEHPRTTAAVTAVDACNLVVVGGAPSLSSAEVYTVKWPEVEGTEQPSSEDEAVTHRESKARKLQIDDMPEGRMGCQAALVNLPGSSLGYPLTQSQCVVVVGGERCDEDLGDVPRVRQFKDAPVYDIAQGVWRKDKIVPDMAAERTAVALCVGLGYVTNPNAACSTSSEAIESSY